MPLRCDMRFEKGEKKKDRPKVGSNHWSIASKRHDSWFTICTTEADTSIDSAVLLVVLPVPWLTDVSSSQRWVIYSQTMALSQTIPTSSGLSDCRCVFWLVILFSNLYCVSACYNVSEFLLVSELLFFFIFAFVICYFVFWIVICFALIGHRTLVTNTQQRM